MINVWRKRISRILVILLLLPMLTGCWDRLEIEDRAVVLAIAIDEAKPQEANESSNATQILKAPKSNKSLIRLTVQIAVPGRIPLGTGGTGGVPAGQKPVWVLSSIGSTINDSIMNLQQQLADRLFFGHLRVIVVSEVMARKGIENEKDFFRRQPQVRRTVWMVVSKGKASDIMRATPQLERVPTLYLVATLDHAKEMGKLPNNFLGVFYSASSAKGQEGSLPYLELKKESNIEIAGMAYFKGDKMEGITTPLQIGHFMAMKQINPGGYSVITHIPGSDTSVIFQSTHRKAKITTEIKDGKIHAKVVSQIEGDLREKSNENLTLTKETIKKLEQSIEKDGKIGFEKLIHQTQKDGCDIFGFGEDVRAFHPSYWNREIKTKQKWEEMYREMSVEVSLRINIRRIGTKTK
ncbi:Ger(x)C family spore germination protein [Paenibacillus andongensis]|uniref:Ger(x)C family spore germination protein n=1 Tax=Paenibacillus andongensis TaxID=2975482 RepID=UPI0021BB120F|nr:Ger(x)C family spore germination protein [Paenibacillus andongensis]